MSFAALQEQLRRMCVNREPQPGHRYACVEEFVLKHGREFPSAPVLPEVVAALDDARREPEAVGLPQARQCFRNAAELVAHDHRLRYVEGYVWLGVASVLHAWASLDGAVVDPTASFLTEEQGWVIGAVPANWAYFGVEIPEDYFVARVLERDYTDSILDDWREDWSVLRGEMDSYLALLNSS